MRMDENKTFDEFLQFSNEVQGEADFHTPPYELLRKIDEYIRKHIYNTELSAPTSAIFLTVNAIWMLYGAARNVLQGQPSVVYPVLRTALENACYVVELCANPKLEDIWRERHHSNRKRDKSRKHFTNAVVNARRKLNDAQPDFGEWMYMMYESFIDFGAHPNPKAIFTHLANEYEETDDGHYKFSFHGLYASTSFEAQKASLAVAETATLIVIILTIALKGMNEDEFKQLNQLNDEKNGLAAAMGFTVEGDVAASL